MCMRNNFVSEGGGTEMRPQDLRRTPCSLCGAVLQAFAEENRPAVTTKEDRHLTCSYSVTYVSDFQWDLTRSHQIRLNQSGPGCQSQSNPVKVNQSKSNLARCGRLAKFNMAPYRGV